MRWVDRQQHDRITATGVYVIYTDPETFKPTMKFFEIVAQSDSQDLIGLKQAVFATYRKLSLESVLNKIVG